MISACPQCGEPTEGSWSEGGAKWALCAECLAAPTLLAAESAERARLRAENRRLAQEVAEADIEQEAER